MKILFAGTMAALSLYAATPALAAEVVNFREFTHDRDVVILDSRVTSAVFTFGASDLKGMALTAGPASGP